MSEPQNPPELPYQLLDRKRRGEALTPDEIQSIVDGVVSGSWGEGEAAAFLMATAIHGLNEAETQALVGAMVASGETWRLRDELPNLVDKHSTGGVGDKVSLILAPLLASVGVPVAMLTGRALGHTGGTADKLETIPGLRLDLDRQQMLDALHQTGVAIGLATPGIAPADRIFYALRDRTGTVASRPLVTSSIVSKKVALGSAAVIYDVKTGPGAIFPELADSQGLLKDLIAATQQAGVKSSGFVTDMSQPLGDWAGHTAEVEESLTVLAGGGADDLLEVTLTLSAEACRVIGAEVSYDDLADQLRSGKALETFCHWARHQGATKDWVAQAEATDARSQDAPRGLAEQEFRLRAKQSGVLAGVDLRKLGLLLQSKAFSGDGLESGLDAGVAIRRLLRLGDPVTVGEVIAIAHLRNEDRQWLDELESCWQIREEGTAPLLIR